MRVVWLDSAFGYDIWEGHVEWQKRGLGLEKDTTSYELTRHLAYKWHVW